MSKCFLFLDFDGVINSDTYFSSPEFKNEAKGRSLFQLLQTNQMHLHIDPKALVLINQIVDVTGATVIASTTWRESFSVEEMNSMISMRGGHFKITDTTPINSFSRPCRDEEIEEYLNEHSWKSFAILDDIDAFFEVPRLSQRFVHTNEKIGITQNDVDVAISMLQLFEEEK